MQILLAIFIVLIPEVAMANTMAPILPILSGIGWLAMPIIVCLEALLYYKAKINNPIKLSLYSNIMSALIGLFFAAISIPVMLGPAIELDLFSIYAGAIITAVGIAFNYWLSSHYEFKFSQWHKLWKNENLKKSTFYKANSLTYGIIFVVLAVDFINKLVSYYEKT